LIIRNLTDTSKADAPMLTLTVIADARLNVSFASVAIRVAVGKLKALFAKGIPAPVALGAASPEASEATTRLAPAQNQSLSGMSGGGSFGVSTGGGALGRSASANVATSGLSWSGLSGSSSVSAGSGVSVADSASSTFLTVCTKALARKVGPLAKVFVKEAVTKVSPERPFSLDNAKDLIVELAKHIKNPSDAQQFREVVEKAL
jgi:hypothetical protein